MDESYEDRMTELRDQADFSGLGYPAPQAEALLTTYRNSGKQRWKIQSPSLADTLARDPMLAATIRDQVQQADMLAVSADSKASITGWGSNIRNYGVFGAASILGRELMENTPASGYRESQRQAEVARLGLKAMMSGNDADYRKALELANQSAQEAHIDRIWGGRSLETMGAIARDIKGMGIGGAIGGTIGGVGGALLGIESGPGSLATGAAGARLGAAVGAGAEMSALASGRTYLAARQNGATHEDAQAIAGTVGAAVEGLNFIGVGHLPGVNKLLATAAMQKVALREAAGATGGAMVRDAAIGSAFMGGVGVAGKIVEETGSNMPRDGLGSALLASALDLQGNAQAFGAGAVLGAAFEGASMGGRIGLRALLRPMVETADTVGRSMMFQENVGGIHQSSALDAIKSAEAKATILRDSMPPENRTAVMDAVVLNRYLMESDAGVQTLLDAGVAQDAIAAARLSGHIEIDVPELLSRTSRGERAKILKYLKQDVDGYSAIDIAEGKPESDLGGIGGIAAKAKALAESPEYSAELVRLRSEMEAAKFHTPKQIDDAITTLRSMASILGAHDSVRGMSTLKSLGFINKRPGEGDAYANQDGNALAQALGQVDFTVQESYGRMRIRYEEAFTQDTLVLERVDIREADQRKGLGLGFVKRAEQWRDSQHPGTRLVAYAETPQSEAMFRKAGWELKRIDGEELFVAPRTAGKGPSEGSQAGAQELNAGLGPTARGAVSTDPTVNLIHLFVPKEGSRPGIHTTIHELSHVFHKQYVELAKAIEAKMEGTRTADEALALEDLTRLNRWAGIKDGATEAEVRAGMEKVARGFERYMMDGNAPVKELEGVFSRLSAWMSSIYRVMQKKIADGGSDLSTPAAIDPEIAGVFDRWLASDAAIRAEMRSRGADDLVETVIKWASKLPGEKAMGVTLALRKALEGAKAIARESQMREVNRQLDQIKPFLIDTAEKAVAGRAVFKSLEELNRMGGKGKREKIDASDLPEETQAILRDAGLLAEPGEGIRLADMANRHGSDPAALAKEIADHAKAPKAKFKDAVEVEYEALRAEQAAAIDPSRIVTKGAAMADTLDAVHAVLREAGMIPKEMRGDLNAMAMERLGQRLVGESGVKGLLRETRNSMTRIFSELSKGDAATAGDRIAAAIYEAQILSRMERFAMDAEDMVTKTKAQARKIPGRDPRKFDYDAGRAVRGLSNLYRLLGKEGIYPRDEFNASRNPMDAAELEGFLRKQDATATLDGQVVTASEGGARAADTLRNLGAKNFKELTVKEFGELALVMNFLDAIGRELAQDAERSPVEKAWRGFLPNLGLRMGGSKASMAFRQGLDQLASLQNMIYQIKALGGPEAKVLDDALNGARREFNTFLTAYDERMVAVMLDRQKELWEAIVDKGKKTVARNFADVVAKTGGYIPDATLADMSGVPLKAIQTARWNALRNHQTAPMRVDLQFILNMMDNFGSDYAESAIDSSYGWEPGTMRAILEGLTKNGYLSEKAWDWTQERWNFSDKELWPRYDAAYKAINRIPLKREAYRPFAMNGKEYAGGYHPLVFDPRYSSPMAEELGLAGKTSGSAAASYRAESLTPGSTIARTGTNRRPLDMENDPFDKHVREVAAYSAYGPFVNDALRIVGRDDFKTMYEQVYGLKSYKALLGNLRRTLRRDPYDPNFMDTQADWGRRKMMTLLTFGAFSMGANVIQSVPLFLHEMRMLPTDPIYLNAQSALVKHPKAMPLWIINHDPYMRWRYTSIYRELTGEEVSRKLVNPKLVPWQEHLSTGKGMFLQLPDAYLGSFSAYMSAVAKHLTEETGSRVMPLDIIEGRIDASPEALRRATDYASGIIVKTNPTGTPEATSAFKDARGLKGLFSAFGTIRNMVVNRNFRVAYAYSHRTAIEASLAEWTTRLAEAEKSPVDAKAILDPKEYEALRTEVAKAEKAGTPDEAGMQKLAAHEEAFLAASELDAARHNVELATNLLSEAPDAKSVIEHIAVEWAIPSLIWTPFAAAGGGMSGETKERKWLRTLAEQSAKQMAMGIPLADQAAQGLVRKMFGGKLFELANPLGLQAQGRIFKALGSPTDVQKGLDAGSVLTGVPVGEMYRWYNKKE
jgi:hypothetical protein